MSRSEQNHRLSGPLAAHRGWSEPDVGSGFVAAHDDMPMLFGRVDFRLWSPDGTRWFA